MPADSNMCAEPYCPRPFSFIWIDHIIAQQHHGETGPDNLALRCLRCNSHKGPNLSGYHPPNQEVTIRTVDADHPLVAAFQGREPFIHRDEPYCFSGPYEQQNFRLLLTMDTEGLRDPQGEAGEMVRYVAWIKPHGQGRVFYCSPSHFPESYTSPTLLRFLLDGTQYASGDLKCDDAPRPQPPLPVTGGRDARSTANRPRA
jgi:hypothetical protein